MKNFIIILFFYSLAFIQSADAGSINDCIDDMTEVIADLIDNLPAGGIDLEGFDLEKMDEFIARECLDNKTSYRVLKPNKRSFHFDTFLECLSKAAQIGHGKNARTFCQNFFSPKAITPNPIVR